MRNLTEIKSIWTIDYQEQSAIIGDFHNIIGYRDIKRSIKIKFKTLYSAYTYSKPYNGVEIKRDGREGGTVVLPGGFVVWTKDAILPFVKKVDIASPLFMNNKLKFYNDSNYVLKVLKAWWDVTPKIFKEYYPGYDLKILMNKNLKQIFQN